MPPQVQPIYLSQLVSQDVVTALSFYQEAFLAALRGFAPPEMVEIGLQDTTSALSYKLPLSVGSSAWQLLTGGVVYDKVGEIMLPIAIPPYAQAVCAEVQKIQSDTWTGWGERPGESAFNAANIGEAALAVALETGESTLSVENFLDGVTVPTSAIKIFQKDHPYSPLDLSDDSATWSNLFTGSDPDDEFRAAPLCLDSIDRVAGASEHMIGMNGKDYYPLTWSWTVVHPSLKRKANRYFTDQGSRNDQVIETSGTSTAQVRKDNHAKDIGCKVLVNRYLTDPTSWYPVFTTPSSRKAPWLTVTQVPAHAIPFSGGRSEGQQAPNMDGMGIEWLIDDLSSDAYRHGNKEAGIPKGHVGIQGIRRVGAGIVNGRQIFRCKGQ